MAARFAELTYYPVKGCAGIPLTQARVTADGLAHDRAYVIVDEAGEPRWQWGERTVRCAITMVDQETGHRDGPEPLRTLADYRRGPDGVVFGAYFTVTREGKVSVGDAVEVGP